MIPLRSPARQCFGIQQRNRISTVQITAAGQTKITSDGREYGTASVRLARVLGPDGTELTGLVSSIERKTGANLRPSYIPLAARSEPNVAFNAFEDGWAAVLV